MEGILLESLLVGISSGEWLIFGDVLVVLKGFGLLAVEDLSLLRFRLEFDLAIVRLNFL